MKKNILLATLAVALFSILATSFVLLNNAPAPGPNDDIPLKDDGIKGLKLNTKFVAKPAQGAYYASARKMGGNVYYDVYRLYEKNGWSVIGYVAVDNSSQKICGLYFTSSRVVGSDGVRVGNNLGIALRYGEIKGSITANPMDGEPMVYLGCNSARVHTGCMESDHLKAKIEQYRKAPLLVDESDGAEYKEDIPLTGDDFDPFCKVFALEIGYAVIDFEPFTKMK